MTCRASADKQKTVKVIGQAFVAIFCRCAVEAGAGGRGRCPLMIFLATRIAGMAT